MFLKEKGGAWGRMNWAVFSQVLVGTKFYKYAMEDSAVCYENAVVASDLDELHVRCWVDSGAQKLAQFLFL